MSSPTVSNQHGVMLNVENQGILITGAAGIGKSSLALAFIHEGQQLIADDLVELQRKGDQLVGSSPPQTYGLLHHRELGLIDVKELNGATAICQSHRLDGIVQLTSDTVNNQKLTAAETITPLLGLSIPTISLSINNACPLTIRIYSWLRNRAIQQKTVASFIQKQQQMMQQ